MPQLPQGTVTFLFTDIEGSTRLWEAHPEVMRGTLARHDDLMREAISRANGYVFKTIGDAFCAAFATAQEALQAVLAAQTALLAESWPHVTPITVRMALHTGAVESRDDDYFGPPVNRVARLLAAAHGGQVVLSQTTYDLVSDFLPEDVSLLDLGSHRLKDLARREQVFQVQHPELPAQFPPLCSLESLPNNLPQQLTTFFGREKEAAHVSSLLQRGRLVTLTGSGGTGKTRLSLQVGVDSLDQYPDGVWLAELAPLASAELVAGTVADVLGIMEQLGQPVLETLCDRLRAKRLLLILDNCEHVLGASATLVNALIRGCANVSILATSREVLGIAGEITYRVPSLSLPDPRKPQTSETLSHFESVRLFVDRASLARPDFHVTNANAPTLASLCCQLDGIPLAIELAAARARSLTIEEIHARLDQRFKLLSGGSRSSLPRQQTLRALIDWSYDLLNETERVMLQRLSVFAGGWFLSAAEHVCATGLAEEIEVLDQLTSLADKSLVIAETRGDSTHFRLLETVRQYARDRLLESGEFGAVTERHLDHFLALVEEAESHLIGPEQAIWLTRLELDHDNLRAALKSTAEGQPPVGAETALRMAAALWRFWYVRGHFEEGRSWLQSALEQSLGADVTLARARAYNGAGAMAFGQGDYDSARLLYEENLSILRELGNQRGIALTLSNLGLISHELGDHAGARALFEQSLKTQRELGDQWGIATSLNNLGNVAHDQGDPTAARTLFEESLSIKRELGDRQGISVSLGNLGLVARDQGDFASARLLLEENLVIQRELGDRRGNAESFEGFGGLALAQQQYTRATRLWGAAESLRKEIGAPIPPNEREQFDRDVTLAREALGNETFAAVWAEGRAMTLEQAITYALGESDVSSHE